VASSVAGGQDPVLLRRVTGRLVLGYSLRPPAPPTLSRKVNQMGRALGG